MIQLEHVNLIVRDIEETLIFYRAAFPHWSIRGGDKGEWSGKPRNWIHFGDDYQYLAFGDNGVGDNRDLAGHQVGLAHFAYVTDDIAGIINRLNDAGFAIAKDGMEDEYRQNIYFLDPNGYEVEFVQYNTDIPNLRNRY
ncbi:VOC family protein [Moritella marina ATCC 15381]|uniref:VOC family protein n=1 Tax=Moritella marina ATCC 15381 TaxID=1202962 RepID=A0A5J6WKG6_MORMI|nr:VOC family protein [Moritella marina]QFI38477.1 VOC family protein [Moritella marina ATCC 15381]